MTIEQLEAAKNNREQHYDLATLLNHLTNDELESIVLKFKREPDFILDSETTDFKKVQKKLLKKTKKILKKIDEEFDEI